jgi:hypothetical protein
MYKDLSNSLTGFDASTKRALSISHSEDMAKVCGIQQTPIVHANYPEHDVRWLKFDDSSFDFIFADRSLSMSQATCSLSLGTSIAYCDRADISWLARLFGDVPIAVELFGADVAGTNVTRPS